MKICVWYEIINKPYGGANTFLGALVDKLKECGHEVIKHPFASADVILINSWSKGPGKYLSPKMVNELRTFGNISYYRKVLPFASVFYNHIKRKGPPLVHRVDGIAALYGRFDESDEIQIKINQLTDYTIFQSKFCRDSFASYGICPQRSMVIYNGVDNRLYYPDRSTKKPSKKLKALAVSWSSNPMKGFSTLVEIATRFDIELTFVGNWNESIPCGNVKVIGTKTALEIASIMRQNDIFIHAAENDPCPNVVLEALASGLPVLYKDSGGTSELAEGYGVPIRFNNIDGSLNEIREKYRELREKILSDRHLFSIKNAAEKYLQVFEELRVRFT